MPVKHYLCALPIENYARVKICLGWAIGGLPNGDHDYGSPVMFMMELPGYCVCQDEVYYPEECLCQGKSLITCEHFL